ncbi:MAG: uracil-DNA glycosylase [Frankia sp.]|nr:uracil-DNA glycosylase [Frankia sp.]
MSAPTTAPSSPDTRASADSAPDWATLRERALGCVACPELAATRTQVVFAGGAPPADVMFVGEAPGFDEDRQGVPFVGRSGQLLSETLAAVGVDRSQVVIANVLKCRPPANRNPLPEEVARCRWWLRRQVHLVDPAVVCTLGAFATRWALGPQARITSVRGRQFTVSGKTVLPTFHPAAALRSGPDGAQMRAFRADIAALAEIARAVRRT